MIDFSREATDRTPEIQGNFESGQVFIRGRSLPEDTLQFYAPFRTWLNDQYLPNKDGIELILSMEYFNTATSRILLDLMRNLDMISGMKKVKVIWVYESDDMDMEETGNDFANLFPDIVELKVQQERS